MPLRNVPDIIVTATFYLHNLCIIHKDKFNMEWAVDAKKDLQKKTNRSLENLQSVNMFKAIEIFFRKTKELQKINPEADETLFIEMEEAKEVKGENDEGEEIKVERQNNIKQMLAKATCVYLLFTKSFNKAHLAQNQLFDLRVATMMLLVLN